MLPRKCASCGRAGAIARRCRCPDDLIGCRLDLFALEQIVALLVAGEVDDLVPVFLRAPWRSRTARRCRGRRRAAARSGLGNLGRRAGRAHDDDLLALPQIAPQPARHAHLEHDHRQQALSSSTHAPVSARPSIISGRRPPPRRDRFEVLQPVKLPGLEVPGRSGAFTITSTIVGVSRSTSSTYARELLVERRDEPRPRRIAIALLCRIERPPAPARRAWPPADTRPSPTPSP